MNNFFEKTGADDVVCSSLELKELSPRYSMEQPESAKNLELKYFCIEITHLLATVHKVCTGIRKCSDSPVAMQKMAAAQANCTYSISQNCQTPSTAYFMEATGKLMHVCMSMKGGQST
jgi:hypothetical protein